MFQTTNQEFSVWPQPSHAEHLLLVMFWGTGNGYVTFPNSSQDHVNHVFLHRKVPTIHQAPQRLWRLQDFRDLANLRSTVNRNTSTNGKIKPRESHIICVRHILSVSIIEIMSLLALVCKEISFMGKLSTLLISSWLLIKRTMCTIFGWTRRPKG